VYKIDLSLLRAYANPETPDMTAYQFERESLIRMIAKGKSLTLYEPGSQVPNPQRAETEPIQPLVGFSTRYEYDMPRTTSPAPDTRMFTAWRPQAAYSNPGVDFQFTTTNKDGIPGPPTKVPPDTDDRRITFGLRVQPDVVRQMEQFVAGVQSVATIASQRLVLPPYNPATMRAPLDRAWRDFKGVVAITIASV
jgi:hypothetical protein